MEACEPYIFLEDSSLAVSKDDSIYPRDSELDTSRFEAISLEPKYDFLLEEPFISNGTTISVPIEDVLRHFRVLRATVISPHKVRDFIYNNSNMVELLRYVVDLISAHFDSNIQLSLEIYQDQETRYETLTLYIRQYTYNDNIMKIIKEIRSEYRQLFPEATGSFLLTTDFRKPR